METVHREITKRHEESSPFDNLDEEIHYFLYSQIILPYNSLVTIRGGWRWILDEEL